MKNISRSLVVIIGVAALAIGGTIAYFSDTETSTGNTFSTGTIDISVDDQNPWTKTFAMSDLKPCETGYIKFNIKNPGNNPVNVWKTIKNITTSNNDPVNKSECVAEGGTWSGSCSGNTAKSNLHDWMNYDLSIKVNVDGNPDDWYQTIYKDKDGVRVGSSSINGKKIFLGMIPAKGNMEVTQSYHLISDTGNWAQADTMNFDIEIYAEQLKGELVLENKSGDPDWQIKGNDGVQGTLTYNLTGPTFDYTFSATGLPTASSEYSLIYYADPWPGNGVSYDTGVLIAKFTATGNAISSTTGSVDLGMDLPKSSDQNHPEGAKIWLVPSTDYSATTSGTQGHMQAWNPANYLFETGLITYDDTDIP